MQMWQPSRSAALRHRKYTLIFVQKNSTLPHLSRIFFGCYPKLCQQQSLVQKQRFHKGVNTCVKQHLNFNNLAHIASDLFCTPVSNHISNQYIQIGPNRLDWPCCWLASYIKRTTDFDDFTMVNSILLSNQVLLEQNPDACDQD